MKTAIYNKTLIAGEGEGFGEKTNLGIELLSRRATPEVSSPRLRFTIEFGMGSKWGRSARDTKKEETFKTARKKAKIKVKPSVC